MVLTAFRLPAELLERIDRFAAQLTASTGIPVQRAESARQLLEAGLRDRPAPPSETPSEDELPEWAPPVKEVSELSDGPEGVGTRRVCQVEFGGRRGTMTERCVAFEPPHRAAYVVDDDSLGFGPHVRRLRLHGHDRGRPPRWFDRAHGHLLHPAKSALQADQRTDHAPAVRKHGRRPAVWAEARQRTRSGPGESIVRSIELASAV